MNRKRRAGKHRGQTLKRIILLTTLLVAYVMASSANWYVNNFGRIGFSSILSTLFGKMEGIASEMMNSYLLYGLLPAVGMTILTGVLIQCFPKIAKYHGTAYVITLVGLSAGLVVYAAIATDLPQYLEEMGQESEIYEQYYVDPESTPIIFPEKKRNLICIVMESMETTFLGQEHGGAMETELMPELYQLARDNVNFSPNEGIGGFRQDEDTSWTMGALVGQTAGVPLKQPSLVDENAYGEECRYLPGITTLNDVLHEHGYYQTFLVGSDAEFGGRKSYFETHGVDRIYDVSTARSDGVIPPDYNVWWGMEDKHLFTCARNELGALSKQNQPFALTLLTVDTHFPSGFVCDLCTDAHEEQYDNVFSCASRQVAQFVDWIREQDFYQDTTIVIVGDHLSMDNRYFSRNVDEAYERRIYNCFINSACQPVRMKERFFGTVDLFPTMLASLGCQIEGEQLGLGINLFSDKATLSERMSEEEFSQQLAMYSQYYRDQFMEAIRDEPVVEDTRE